MQEADAGRRLRHDLRSDRLILRTWRDSDFEPFARMNRDPEVMQFYPSAMTEEQSRTRADKLAGYYETPGYRHWIIEAPGAAPFVGVIGLKPVPFDAHFTPAIEVGWRLAKDQWRKGYASEAARAVFQHGFTTCGLEEIVAFTAVINERSRALMDRLGMTRSPADDFENPEMDAAHPLRPHVLHRIANPSRR